MPIVQVIKCWNCGRVNRALVPEGIPAVLCCAECKSVVVEQHVISGYVYVLKNDSMPGILKIGMTTRTVEERIAELNGTNLPTPFRLVLKYFSKRPQEDEAALHKRLEDYRISDSREFFKCHESYVVTVMKEILTQIGQSFPE